MTTFDAKELVKAYVAIRDERKRLAAEFEATDKGLKDEQEQIGTALLALCNEINSSSIKTDSGIAIRKLKERFFCSDWIEFAEFVKQHDELDLLERRIHQKNFKTYLASHKDEGLPPGVNVTRAYEIEVRKAPSSSSNDFDEGEVNE